MSLLDVIRLPYCDVLTTGPWNAPAGRWFAALRARHGFGALLGHAVIEEFGTISSPLFFAPRALLGQIYDAGITLAHRRDRELGIDLGWPPLCVGLDRAAPGLPARWQDDLLAAVERGGDGAGDERVRTRAVDGEQVALIRFDDAGRGASVVATTAPLLPAQLGRLCDLDDRALTIAYAAGNRVVRQAGGRAQEIAVLSEKRFRRIAAAVEELTG
jgi:hypothetical protein